MYHKLRFTTQSAIECSSGVPSGFWFCALTSWCLIIDFFMRRKKIKNSNYFNISNNSIIFFLHFENAFLLWLPGSNVGFLACRGVVVNTSGRLPSSSLLPFTIFLQREFFAIPPQYFKIFYNFPQYLPIAQCSDKKEITFQVKENFWCRRFSKLCSSTRLWN